MAILTGMSVSVVIGCSNDVGQANQQQVAAQQTQIEQMQQQIAELQANGPPSATSTTIASAGGCDTAVMDDATRRAGEKMAAGDSGGALGYYQDAVTACPSSARAQLNVAHAFEAIGDQAHALAHYRLAAAATGSGVDADAVQQAQQALARLGGAS